MVVTVTSCNKNNELGHRQNLLPMVKVTVSNKNNELP